MKEKRVTCPKCHKEYKKGRSIQQHRKHCGRRYHCPHCPESCCEPWILTRHVNKFHPDSQLNGGRLPSYIPEATKRTAATAFEEDDIEPSLNNLLEENNPTPMFQNESIPSNISKEPASFKRKLDDYDSSSCTTEEVHGEEDALCNEACDQLFPEECDFFCSQGEGDTLCNQAYEQHEHNMMMIDDYREQGQNQMGGNPLGRLFEFRLRQIGPRRRWNEVVAGVHYNAELQQLRDPVRGDNIGVAISEALFDVIHDELQNHPRTRHINFSITAHGFTHAFQSANFEVHEFLERSFRLDDMLRTLSGKLNSNQSFDPQRGFQLDILFVYNPPPSSGRGRKRQVGLKAWKKDSTKKQSIIPIQNSDDLCCARAIVTMKAFADKEAKKQQLQTEQQKDRPDSQRLDQLKQELKNAQNQWNNLRDGKPEQKRLAQQLHKDSGVPEGPCSLEEVKQFQAQMTPHYQLQVMCRSKPFALLYQGEPAPLKINLLKSDTHFEGCTSFPAFVNRSYFCELCGKGYDHEDSKHHPCEGRICRSCQSTTCPDYDKHRRPHQLCSHCNGLFYGSTCLQEHQRTGQCDSFKHCLKCSAEYQVIQGKPHRCFFTKCRSCEQFVNIQEHRCFIQPLKDDDKKDKKKKKKPRTPLFVYADIEAMTMPDRSFQVNLLCYRTSEEDTIHSLWGEQGCFDFLEQLDVLSETQEEDEEEESGERPVITLFHNLKGFDGLFILSELYKQQRDVEKQLTVGAKVLSFKVGSLTFKDSLCFLPMSLDAFTKTFGLTESKKGYFPHAFNTPENQDYKGPIPDKSFYDPDGMMDTKKKAFDTWYADQVRQCEEEEYVFDMKKELEEYCHSDVALLQGGCEAFSKEFKDQSAFNAFAECVTIASACNQYFRRHHLKENTIAIEPPRGWRGANVNQSKKALQWLYYQESLIPKDGASAERIRHVRNGGEQRVFTDTDPFFVDGLDPVTNTIYEFHGCLWHGHTCYRRFRDVKQACNPDRTLNELYRDTLFKMASLQNSGYTVVQMWECHWDQLVQQDPHVKAFVETCTFVEPLEPRDAFFGGRTGAVALYDKVKGEEEIHYMDVTSLYPWVNKTGLYPIGHPIIISQPEQTLESYFGVAKVDILPPEGLYHPVLPVRQGGKLTFPLCQACVIENQAKQDMLERVSICHHTDEQRLLRGTWCTPEIQKALEVGYELKRVHEVWHFPQRERGLFKEYVNTWLKIKQESAGWPRHCTTDEEKQAYIERYEREEGITLDPEKIASNPGRKQTAKLMLNSFWGKFGERENKSQTVQVQTPAALYNLLDDPTKDISMLRICTSDNLEVVYTNTQANVTHSTKTNVFIAAFTTCWARLKLYDHLEALQTQVLYYDTDSVIYKWAPGLHKIQTGDLLGEMTDELDGDVIEEFVAGGAKNYGYKTKQGKYECKVRGFTLNVRGKEKLNYHSMKHHILAEVKDPLEHKRVIPVTNPNYFKRDVEEKGIQLTKRIKNYGLVFDKRVLDPTTMKSVPFGFKRIRDDIDLLMEL